MSKTPETRQTALFSATLPKQIRRLAQKYMNEPESITIAHEKLTVNTIEQSYYLVNESDKLAVLTRLFEVMDISRAIIFARTRVGTGELANALATRGFPAEGLSGDLSQDARERVMKRFRNNQIKVLVATDVAARGLDIDDVTHVFNFDLPPDPEVYVHRIGRTGRVGKQGIAISFVTPRERGRLRRTEQLTKQRITEAKVPTTEEIQEIREGKLVENMLVWLRRGRARREREIVVKLAEEGYDPLEVAAAALKMSRAQEKQRPIEHVGAVRDSRGGGGRRDGGRRDGGRRDGGRGRNDRRSNDRRSSDRNGSSDRGARNGGSRSTGGRSHETGMVRLQLDAGKDKGIRPNDIVGTIAHHADIPGRSIGAIRIQEEKTFVDIPTEYVDQVIAKASLYKIHQQQISVERA